MKTVIGSRTLTEDEFKTIVKGEIDLWLEQNQPPEANSRTDGFHRAGLYGSVIGGNRRNFDIQKKKETWGGIDPGKIPPISA